MKHLRTAFLSLKIKCIHKAIIYFPDIRLMYENEYTFFFERKKETGTTQPPDMALPLYMYYTI